MTLIEEIKERNILTVAHHDFQKGMNVHANFKLNDRYQSEDLVQETFTKTWRYLVRGGKVQTMKAFLYHVLNGLIVDTYRKHKTSSLEVLLEKGFDPSANDGERLPNFIDGKAASQFIKFLPSPYQKVMTMRYMQDLTLSEMALITGKSKNTMAVQAHRGLEKLKVLYKDSGSH